jgi:hypothetical protein
MKKTKVMKRKKKKFSTTTKPLLRPSTEKFKKRS